MARLRILVGFANIRGHALEEIARHVLASLCGNAVYLPLAAPVILVVKNSGTGRLTLGVTPTANARLYEAQSQTAPNAATGAGVLGEWQSAGMFTSTRAMAVMGLVPGGMYNFRVRAVGGSTCQSEWSNPVGHMSL